MTQNIHFAALQREIKQKNDSFLARARDPTERSRVPAHFTRYRWTLSQGLTASDTATREQPSIWGENIIFGHASPHSRARGIPQICPVWGMEPPQKSKGVGVGVQCNKLF